MFYIFLLILHLIKLTHKSRFQGQTFTQTRAFCSINSGQMASPCHAEVPLTFDWRQRHIVCNVEASISTATGELVSSSTPLLMFGVHDCGNYYFF